MDAHGVKIAEEYEGLFVSLDRPCSGCFRAVKRASCRAVVVEVVVVSAPFRLSCLVSPTLSMVANGVGRIDQALKRNRLERLHGIWLAEA